MNDIRVTLCLIAMFAVASAGRTTAPDDHGPLAAGAVAAHDPHDDHDDHDDAHGHGHDGHADEVRLTADAIRRHGITTARAARQRLVETITVPGRVAFDAESMAHVGAAVAGRVVEIRVRAGDTVEAGATLLIVESAELGESQSALLERLAAVRIAGASVVPARQALDRAKALFDENEGVSLAEVQRRESELRSAEGVLAAAETSAAAARDKLGLLGMSEAEIDALAASGRLQPRYAVRSPLAGKVIEREVTLGELVSPDKEALLVVANLASVWVLADVPELHLSRMGVGTVARTRVAGSADPVEGKVTYIADALDLTTRTGRVRVAVPNPAGSLRPGMFARVEVAVGPAEDEPVLAVPEEAVQTVEGRSVVFVPVAGEPNTFAARPVTVDAAVGGLVPIRSGLDEGDDYVRTGTFILKADLGKAGAAHKH